MRINIWTLSASDEDGALAWGPLQDEHKLIQKRCPEWLRVTMSPAPSWLQGRVRRTILRSEGTWIIKSLGHYHIHMRVMGPPAHVECVPWTGIDCAIPEVTPSRYLDEDVIFHAPNPHTTELGVTRIKVVDGERVVEEHRFPSIEAVDRWDW